MAVYRRIVFVFIFLLYHKQRHGAFGWCVDEDNKKDCFFNIRSKASDDFKRAVRFLDSKDASKAVFAFTPKESSIDLYIGGEDPTSHVFSVVSKEKNDLKIGVGKHLPEYTMDIATQTERSILQLKGNGKPTIPMKLPDTVWKSKGVVPSALLLSDFLTDKKWYLAHQILPISEFQLGYQTDKGTPKKDIFSISSDAPPKTFRIDNDGSISLSAGGTSNKGMLYIKKSRGDGTNPQIVGNGDPIGEIGFQAYDGKNFMTVFSIAASVDGGPASVGKLGGKLSVFGRTFGPREPTEMIIVDGEGNIKFDMTSFILKTASMKFTLSDKDANLDGSLSISEELSINKNVQVGSNLRVNGSTTIVGKTSLEKGNLEIMDGNFFCKNNLEIEGTISSKGSIRTEGSLEIESGAKIKQSLEVLESSIMGTTLEVGGETTFRSSMNLESGNLYVRKGSVSISEGNLSIASKLFFADSTTKTISIDGDISTFGSLKAVGSTTLESGLKIQSEGASIIGNVDISGHLSLTDGVQISSEEDSDSAETGSITTLGGIGISKSANVGQDLIVQGSISASSIKVNELSKFQNGLHASFIIAEKGVHIGSKALLEDSEEELNHPPGTISAIDALLTGKLSVGENASFNSSVLLQSSCRIKNGLNVSGLASFSDDLIVNGSVRMSSISVLFSADNQTAFEVSENMTEVNTVVRLNDAVVMNKSANILGDLHLNGRVLFPTTTKPEEDQISHIMLQSTQAGEFTVSAQTLQGIQGNDQVYETKDLLSIFLKEESTNILSKGNNSLNISTREKLTMISESSVIQASKALSLSTVNGSASLFSYNGSVSIGTNSSKILATPGGDSGLSFYAHENVCIMSPSNITFYKPVRALNAVQTELLCDVTGNTCMSFQENKTTISSSSENITMLDINFPEQNISMFSNLQISGDVSITGLNKTRKSLIVENGHVVAKDGFILPPQKLFESSILNLSWSSEAASHSSSGFVEIVPSESSGDDENSEISVCELAPIEEAAGKLVFVKNSLSRMLNLKQNASEEVILIAPGKTAMIMFDGREWVSVASSKHESIILENVTHFTAAKNLDIGAKELAVSVLRLSSEKLDINGSKLNRVALINTNGTLSASSNMSFDNEALHVPELIVDAIRMPSKSLDLNYTLGARFALINDKGSVFTSSSLFLDNKTLQAPTVHVDSLRIRSESLRINETQQLNDTHKSRLTMVDEYGAVSSSSNLTFESSTLNVPNISSGAIQVRSGSLNENDTITNRICLLDENGILSVKSNFSYDNETLQVPKIGSFEASGSIDMRGNQINNVTIQGGNLLGISRLDVGSTLVLQEPAIEKSDARLKTSVTHIDANEAHTKLLKLQGVSYKLKNGGGTNLGFIAQDVLEIFPEIVSEIESESPESYLGIKYSRLVPILVESIKNLNDRVERLENMVETLLKKDI